MSGPSWRAINYHLHRPRAGSGSQASPLPLLTVKRPPSGSWPVAEDGAPTKVLTIGRDVRGRPAMQSGDMTRRPLGQLQRQGLTRSSLLGGVVAHQSHKTGVRYFFLDAAVVEGWRQRQEELSQQNSRDRFQAMFTVFLAVFAGAKLLQLLVLPDLEVEKKRVDEAEHVVKHSISALVARDPATRLVCKGSTRPIQEVYDISHEGGILGEGAYGTVIRGTHRGTGTERALKRVKSQSTRDLEAVRREVEAQVAMDHPNICRLIEFFDTGGDLWLVSELCRGGELYDLMQQLAGQCSEEKVAEVMVPVIRSVRHCHQNSVLHRDIKPENVLLLSGNGPLSEDLKLIDFGFATRTPGTIGSTSPTSISASTSTSASSATKMSSYDIHPFSGASSTSRSTSVLPGTVFYSSPQVICGVTPSESDDVWSLGVMLYLLLVGSFPYPSSCSEDEKLEEFVKGGKLQPWLEAKLSNLDCSHSARDLLSGLLAYDAEDRLTLEEALAHPFLKKRDGLVRGSDSCGEKLHELSREDVRQRLFRFANLGVLRRVACCALVRLSDSADVTGQQYSDYVHAFEKLDVHGDGRIGYAELEQLFGARSPSAGSSFGASLRNFFANFAPAQTSSGSMEASPLQREAMGYTCFVAAMCFGRPGGSALGSEERLWRNVFEALDFDHDEAITMHDLKKSLGLTLWESRRAMVEAVESIGGNVEGGASEIKLLFPEFLELVRTSRTRHERYLAELR